MKLIYRTRSTEFANAVRAEFDRAGIAHYISMAPEGIGMGGAAALGHSVFVLHEEDWSHGVEVLAELGAFDRPAPKATRSRTAPGFLRAWPFLLALAVALLFGFFFTH